MRLVVTGFGSFQGVAQNPTELLIHHLRTITDLHTQLGAREVELRVVPVAASAADAFAEEVARCRQDAADNSHLLIVHLGVDASCRTPTIALERVAHNECGFRCPDEDGVVLGCDHAPCSTSGLGARLETGLDVERLRARMEARRDARGGRYQVQVSEDAGRFLCNYIFARSLSACKGGGGGGGGDRGDSGESGRCCCKADALFVHVPPFSVLGEEAQREALLDLLRELVELVVKGGS